MDEDMAKRINKLEDRVNVLDKNGAVMEVLLKNGQDIQNQFSNALDKFSGVITGVEKTLLQIQGEAKTTKDDLSELDKKVEALEEKGKIDWMLIVKQNLGKLMAGVVLGGGFIAGFAVLVSKLVN